MRRQLIFGAMGTLMMLSLAVAAVLWFSFRIYVPPEKCCVLIRKMGSTPPSGQRIATESGQKGIQAQVLGPGRHYRNPLIWDHELVDLTVIPSGKPDTWEWISSLDDRQRDDLRAGTFKFRGDFPKIGVVTRRIGKKRPTESVMVTRESGYEGILEEVLTPGVYKINPYVYEVEIHAATVIPAGFVGVVTNLFGEQPKQSVEAVAQTVTGTQPTSGPTRMVRPLAEPGQRGTLQHVLQPGVYFINPKLQKVTMIEIGFNEYSQLKLSENENLRISFPSDTGYTIRVGVTLVWGIHPAHAAEIINEYGNVDRVLDKVIEPQLRSICRNIGSTFAARDFIQGEKREEFQREMTDELKRVGRTKNIEVLIALVREIEVLAPTGIPGSDKGEVTEDLKRTIQQSHIAIENRITKEMQREAATVKAQLEEVKKEVDIAREMITGETGVLVAQIRADGEKEAALIDAQAELEVAEIQQQAALLEAQRTEILGQAHAEVKKLKGAAEADGYKMLVDAFGSPRAYNLYTFAENFKPESVRLFYAGEGTFWTDLSRFEQVGAAKLLDTRSKDDAGQSSKQPMETQPSSRIE